MSQNNSNDKAAMLAKIEGINKVDGFDPTPFAVDYTDLETGEVRKRLPVMIQMAWFRMKYPEGRIAITVSPGKDCFVATAKVYPSYKDGAECYLAEATASRGYLADKPSVSPREWAQTAAVGIALRNAGFGLQFAMAGDEFEDTATDELNGNGAQAGGSTPHESYAVTPDSETEDEYTVEPTAPPQRELTFEEKVEQAMRVPCPITKYGGKTLGDVLQMDPKAISVQSFPGRIRSYRMMLSKRSAAQPSFMPRIFSTNCASCRLISVPIRLCSSVAEVCFSDRFWRLLRWSQRRILWSPPMPMHLGTKCLAECSCPIVLHKGRCDRR